MSVDTSDWDKRDFDVAAAEFAKVHRLVGPAALRRYWGHFRDECCRPAGDQDPGAWVYTKGSVNARVAAYRSEEKF